MPPVSVIRSLFLAIMLAVVAPSCAESDPERSERPARPSDAEQDDDGSPQRDASVPVLRDAAMPSGATRDAASADAASLPRDAGVEGAVDASVANDGGVRVDAGACSTAQVGWSTVAGDGVSATTGGGSATPVRPKSVDELVRYARDEQPRVIEIAGSFDVPRLDIASNKTLIGIGPLATVRGGLRIRGKADAQVHNVIVRNLRVDGATSAVDDDAVQIYFAHHVWIDHCEIWDGPDGNLDMTHAVSWVTVSWTKLRYSERYQKPAGESNDHRFAALIGHSDGNASEDEGRLKVTFHHNHWGERVIERMPRVRFGQVHVFNDYFAAQGNNYCVRAGRGAQLLIESSYFERVSSPHEFHSSADEATAHITARDNVYDGTTGERATGGGGKAFVATPYAATVDPAAAVPALVKACAGPR